MNNKIIEPGMLKDTEIIMYDSTIKKIQHIKVGDKVMGHDGTIRNVLTTTNGKDKMYLVKNVKGESYIVNSEYILSLRYSNKKQINHRNSTNSYSVRWFENMVMKSKNFSYKNKDKQVILNEAKQFLDNIKEDRFINISIKDYLNLSNTWKTYLKGYKTNIEFSEKQLDFDPYIIGLWLGDGTSTNMQITNQDASIIKYLKENLGQYNCYLSCQH